MNLRTDRLQQEYKKVINEYIQNEMEGLRGAIISLTKINVSKDLKHATVFVSIFSPSQDKKVIFGKLVDSQSAIRHYLSKIMTQRTVPEIKFLLDETEDYKEHIYGLIDSISKKD